ncbi:hypothetical protein N2152v2_006188 [Parachlorella kessleri]
MANCRSAAAHSKAFKTSPLSAPALSCSPRKPSPAVQRSSRGNLRVAAAVQEGRRVAAHAVSAVPSEAALELVEASDLSAASCVSVPSHEPVPEESLGQRLLRGYDAALRSNPVQTKALTSFVGFALGDVLAQGILGDGFDVLRCLRLSLYGLLLDGPIGHAWYQQLDSRVYPDEPTSNRAVLIKTAADQLLWAPVMTCVFFAFIKLLELQPELILPTIQDKLVKTIVANYVLWPLAHWINFRYVPSEYRILYNNVVAVAWTCYLSASCVGLGEGAQDLSDAAVTAESWRSALPCAHHLPHHHEVAAVLAGGSGDGGLLGATLQGMQGLGHSLGFDRWNLQGFTMDSAETNSQLLQLKMRAMEQACKAKF